MLGARVCVSLPPERSGHVLPVILPWKTAEELWLVMWEERGEREGVLQLFPDGAVGVQGPLIRNFRVSKTTPRSQLPSLKHLMWLMLEIPCQRRPINALYIPVFFPTVCASAFAPLSRSNYPYLNPLQKTAASPFTLTDAWTSWTSSKRYYIKIFLFTTVCNLTWGSRSPVKVNETIRICSTYSAFECSTRVAVIIIYREVLSHPLLIPKLV